MANHGYEMCDNAKCDDGTKTQRFRDLDTKQKARKIQTAF